MNAVKAVEDILRPKSPAAANNIALSSDTNENQGNEKRTTLIKMAGTASGGSVAATPQQTSTVRDLLTPAYISS